MVLLHVYKCLPIDPNVFGNFNWYQMYFQYQTYKRFSFTIIQLIFTLILDFLILKIYFISDYIW